MTQSEVQVNGPLSAQIRALVDQADGSVVPSGVLLWFGNTALPTGTEEAPPIVDGAAWAGILLRMNGGTVRDAGTPLPPLPAVQHAAAQPGEPVPIAILSAAFHRPTEQAAAAVTAAATTGQPADLPERIEDAIEAADAFVVAALLADQWHRPVPAHRGRSIRLTLPPDVLVSNHPDGGIDDVSVDAGNGWQSLDIGGSIEIEPPAGADHLQLTVRCSTPIGVRTGRCTLALSEEPPPPAPDEVWQLVPESGNPGHAFVFRGEGERLRRPILIAEGWPGNASAAFLADGLGQHDLLGRWRRAGHDVVIVGFDRGLDSIQSNTGVVRAAVERAHSRTEDDLVVGGMSMGALVSRLALMEMEHDGVDHRAAVYLSIDGPHGRGAYTTIVGQWLVQHFTWLSPAYAGLSQMIRSPSNLEFISLIETDGAVGPDPRRIAFLAELDRLGGYPGRPVKLAISCGQGAGNSDAPPTAPVLEWQVDGLVDVVLAPMPSDGERQIASGAVIASPQPPPPPLVVCSEVCWESVPGSRDVLNRTVMSIVASFGCAIDTTLGTSASVPTVSSLDVDGDPHAPIPPPGSGASPFDDYVWSATNQRHLEFTAEIVDWLVARVELHQPASNRSDNSTSGAR